MKSYKITYYRIRIRIRIRNDLSCYKRSSPFKQLGPEVSPQCSELDSQSFIFFSTKYTHFRVHVVNMIFFFPSNHWCFRKAARREDLYPYRFPPSLWSVRERQGVATWLRHKFESYLSVWSHWINFCFRRSTSRLSHLLRDNLPPQVFQSHLLRLRCDRLLGPRTRSKKKSRDAILLKS